MDGAHQMTVFTLAAATWPLLAGLSLVFWSKARANAAPRPIPVRVEDRK